jgi:hypothetical protein
MSFWRAVAVRTVPDSQAGANGEGAWIETDEILENSRSFVI